jgi:hypothetical protein
MGREADFKKVIIPIILMNAVKLINIAKNRAVIHDEVSSYATPH